MIASNIKQWFARAVAEPNDKNRAVQLGVHVEEFAEMWAALGCVEMAASMSEWADYYKKEFNGPLDANRIELLDALCDQIVTAIGVAHMMRFDILGALREVNASNWSKFDEFGRPIFDANGKIKKGPLYRKPDLTAFVGEAQ